jgi:hypothetical protein
MNYSHLAVAAYLLDQVRRRAIGGGGFCWDLTCHLPVAPTIEESLRIAMQDWDAESVEFYITDCTKKGSISLSLVSGKPVHIEGIPDLMLVVHTDEDHRYRWRVTEVSSGCAMSKPQSSEQDALDAVQRAVSRYGADGIRTVIRNVIEGQVEAFKNGEAFPSTLTPVAPTEAATLQAHGVDAKVGDLMQNSVKTRRRVAKND